MRFAIVDRNRAQADILKMLLKSEGHQGECFADGQACLQAINSGAFDFFIFDWMPTDIAGSQLLEDIRRRCGWRVPVIVYSAQASEENVSDILQAGADDFVAKPIRYMELLARIAALLRHTQLPGTARIRIGMLEVDPATRAILVDGADAQLTQREFDLATLFLSHIGRIFSRNELLTSLWPGEITTDTRTVDTHTSRVRKKLRLDGASGLMLSSVYGKSYRLDTVQTD